MAADLLAFALASDPTKTAVIAGDDQLSFRELHRRANALTTFLRMQGFKPGDRVALLSKNDYRYFEIQLACMRAGLIFLPLNFRLTEAELSYITGDAEPVVLFTSLELQQVAREVCTTCIPLDQGYEDIVTAGEPDDTLPVLDPTLDCAILYTSGTTGRPKGAVLTNRTILARIQSNLFEYSVSADDIFLQCLPLFHIACNVSFTFMYAGATNVLLRDFNPLTVFDLIASHRVTTMLVVPTMINALINQPESVTVDIASLGRIAYGASSIPPTVLSRAMALFGCQFVQQYGMTETSAATALRSRFHDAEKFPDLLSSAGQTAIGMEARIVDESDKPVANGQIGEIVCRGEPLMKGYWRNEAATQEALKGGWMHTGDLGYRDERGFFFVTDRKKDMIVSGGENIYPREVEDVLYEHPEVVEAAVIGIPDEKWGETVHAIIVLRPTAVFDAVLFDDFLRKRLAGYKIPRSFKVQDELPKNATGKVLKTELRRLYQEESK